MSQRLQGGSFNLKYGRDPKIVLREVERLGRKHELDFLNVQEFSDYRDRFREVSQYWRTFPRHGPCETGILVRRGLEVSRASIHTYGDGWITVRGGRAPACVQCQVLLDDWLWDRSVHIPTPSEWHDGRLKSPPERADDLKESMLGLQDYLDHPAVLDARLAAGDWNEPPSTSGRFTPHWLAKTTGSNMAAPVGPGSMEGHGRIDYVLAKGARITDIRKDTAIPELSDHEPVIYGVVKR